MIGKKHCPYCLMPATRGCEHLALAVEARDFVRRCIESCQGQSQWLALCQNRHNQFQRAGEWSPECEDYTWLETAFCSQFLKDLVWFGEMDHEWRTGPKEGQGGFWVLLWSKDPKRLWWELKERLERDQGHAAPIYPEPSMVSSRSAPWLLTPESNTKPQT
jgi:hypothetical protein